MIQFIHLNNNKENSITNEMLQNALDTKIPRDVFLDYHKKIIDTSIPLEKEIVFSEDHVPTISSKITIEDREKTLNLHKKDKK